MHSKVLMNGPSITIDNCKGKEFTSDFLAIWFLVQQNFEFNNTFFSRKTGHGEQFHEKYFQIMEYVCKG